MSLAPSPSKTWRVALVGAGYFAQFHLEGWRSIANVEVVALCDVNLAAAAQLAQRFGVAKTYSSLQELLALEKVDVIDLVTPPATQAGLLDQLYVRGIPIICQKPLGTSFEQAQMFVAQAKQHNMKLIVHENFRFMPWYRELKRLIESNFFGELYGITFRLRTGDGQGENAYLERQPYFQTMPRLLIAETGIHMIDTFRYLMGEVQAVYAQLRRLNPAIQGEDAGLVTFEFMQGAVGVLDGNRLVGHPAANSRRTFGELWLEGAKGVMRLDGDARLWWLPYQSSQASEVEHVYQRGSEAGFGSGACEHLQRHLIEALTQDRTPENTAEAYLQNIRVQEAIYASAATGTRIPLF